MQACRKFLSIFPKFYTVIINPSWKERKKAQSSTWCLNTLCFHFTLFLSGWSLKGNSKGKWKYFTQKIESICSAIWKLIGEKSWVFKTEFWQLEADVTFFLFFPLSLSSRRVESFSRGNEILLSNMEKLTTCSNTNYLENIQQVFPISEWGFRTPIPKCEMFSKG